jgi:hypothetical protein
VDQDGSEQDSVDSNNDAPGNTASCSPQPTNTADNNNNNNLHGGPENHHDAPANGSANMSMVAGAAAGGAVVLLGVGIAVYCCCCRGRRPTTTRTTTLATAQNPGRKNTLNPMKMFGGKNTNVGNKLPSKAQPYGDHSDVVELTSSVGSVVDGVLVEDGTEPITGHALATHYMHALPPTAAVNMEGYHVRRDGGATAPPGFVDDADAIKYGK